MGRATTDPKKLARKARKEEIREKLGDLSDYKITNISEINELYKDFIGMFLENGLEAELEAAQWGHRGKNHQHVRQRHDHKRCTCAW